MVVGKGEELAERTGVCEFLGWVVDAAGSGREFGQLLEQGGHSRARFFSRGGQPGVVGPIDLGIPLALIRVPVDPHTGHAAVLLLGPAEQFVQQVVHRVLVADDFSCMTGDS